MLFASVNWRKDMEFSRNMRPTVPSPGNRHWSWSSRRESLGSGEEAGSTWGSAKGLFFFFALKYGYSQKDSVHSRWAVCWEHSGEAHRRTVCPGFVRCDLTQVKTASQ